MRVSLCCGLMLSLGLIMVAGCGGISADADKLAKERIELLTKFAAIKDGASMDELKNKGKIGTEIVANAEKIAKLSKDDQAGIRVKYKELEDLEKKAIPK